MSRRSNGRPKGSITKRCLIKDPILLPYEIHIDDTSHSFQVVKADSGNIDGYYTQLPLALKSILKKRLGYGMIWLRYCHLPIMNYHHGIYLMIIVINR